MAASAMMDVEWRLIEPILCARQGRPKKRSNNNCQMVDARPKTSQRGRSLFALALGAGVIRPPSSAAPATGERMRPQAMIVGKCREFHRTAVRLRRGR